MLNINIPDEVNFILKKLNSRGFEAYIVGGCVRDSMMNITPKDYDICTSAVPEQIESCFEDFKTLEVGKKHGTISVIIGKNIYEITTFRVDGEYLDSRHPQKVEFSRDVITDLSRRDFTINAMAYSEGSGLIDPFGGKADLKDRLIKCVGSPEKRFSEDALRILRGLRFASRFDFALEQETVNAVHALKASLNNIAAERIREELIGITAGESAERILLEYRDVFAEIIPELKPCFDFEQRTPHHYLDVYAHIARTVCNIEPEPLLRITMLLHDVGKPKVCTTDKNGRRHFKGHPLISAQMADDILRRLRFPNDFISDCVTLIEYHDVRFKGSKTALKRVIGKIGEQNTQRLFKIQRADILAQSDYRREQKLNDLNSAEIQFEEIIKNNECCSLKQLSISGEDVKSLGIAEGKEIGNILNELLEKVISGEVENDREELIKIIILLSNKIL